MEHGHPHYIACLSCQTRCLTILCNSAVFRFFSVPDSQPDIEIANRHMPTVMLISGWLTDGKVGSSCSWSTAHAYAIQWIAQNQTLSSKQVARAKLELANTAIIAGERRVQLTALHADRSAAEICHSGRSYRKDGCICEKEQDEKHFSRFGSSSPTQSRLFLLSLDLMHSARFPTLCCIVVKAGKLTGTNHLDLNKIHFTQHDLNVSS
eukprot:1160143-Pelagomonas_calceolata.AAC.4